ncbi:ABC transporter permease [Schumannella soli]|uniref:ABC transporter permease n=1 Tax=Schumannella soli TaxID=2590779 RepID=A0A506XY09_9MICO|nr:FtsX-like permease family protein [Schumannella soli]TPW77784.1 ABC transporter permease [Schumannella soli]
MSASWPQGAPRTVLRRWKRNLLTVVAVSLGAGSVVALLAITQSSAARLVERLSSAEGSVVIAGLPGDAWDVPETVLLSNLGSRDVQSAGTLVLPDTSGAGADITLVTGGDAVRGGLVVATNEGLETRQATLEAGRPFPVVGVQNRDARYAMIGTRLARQLGFTLASGPRALMVNGTQVTVSAIVHDGPTGTALSTSVILTPAAAERLELLPPNRIVQVRTQPASTADAAKAIPRLLYPKAPEEVSVQFPSRPEELRRELLGDSNDLLSIVASIMVGVTAFSIVTTMQIAVSERRREIGIARALGMSRARVGSEFLLEAAFLGLIGSGVGWILGVLLAALVTRLYGWELVVPPMTAFVPVGGLLVGAAAGTWPAVSASRLDPGELLRS